MSLNFVYHIAGISNSFLSNSTAGTSTNGSSSALLVQGGLIALIVLFFYFIIIRPQKKKEKESQAMRTNVQIGDEITTVGGIVGIVVRKNEDSVVIETGGDKSKLRIKTWAIQDNLTAHAQAEPVQKD